MVLNEDKGGNMQILGKIFVVIGSVFAVMCTMAVIKKPSSIYKRNFNQRNPLEGKKVVFIKNMGEKENADGVCGHLEAVGDSDSNTSIYDKVIKRGMDVFLSFLGLLLLAPLLLGISLAIVIDDPGPVLFVQKRIGRNKRYFRLHKFRSMKMSTPHDVPTHMLMNPNQCITRVGRFIRTYSLDELPQIWDIFMGNMSIIGPRPALWNQDILTAERDKYGANDIKPGLTGWAQINGRDELEISVKARLDGEYAEKLKKGGRKAFLFDCHCFMGTVFSVIRGDGVVEGRNGKRGLSSK